MNTALPNRRLGVLLAVGCALLLAGAWSGVSGEPATRDGAAQEPVTNVVCAVDPKQLADSVAGLVAGALKTELEALKKEVEAVRNAPQTPVSVSLGWWVPVWLAVLSVLGVVALTLPWVLRTQMLTGVNTQLINAVPKMTQELRTRLTQEMAGVERNIHDLVDAMKGAEAKLASLQSESRTEGARLVQELRDGLNDLSGAFRQAQLSAAALQERGDQLANQVNPEGVRGVLEQATQQWQASVANQLPSLNAEIQGQMETVLGSARERIEEIRTLLTQAVAPFEEQTRRLLDRLRDEEQSVEALIWPAFFSEAPLLAWREKIEAGLARRDSAAFELYLAVGIFNSALKSPEETRRVADALHGVGVQAYRFWKALGCAELEAAQEWKEAFNEHLRRMGVKLEAVLVLENQNFSLNTMVATNPDNANRITVKEVLSWIVQDIARETPRILGHARVITC